MAVLNKAGRRSLFKTKRSQKWLSLSIIGTHCDSPFHLTLLSEVFCSQAKTESGGEETFDSSSIEILTRFSRSLWGRTMETNIFYAFGDFIQKKEKEKQKKKKEKRKEKNWQLFYVVKD